MDEPDVNTLYDLVRSTPYYGELPPPALTLSLSNPSCGDEVSFFVEVDEQQRINRLKFKTKGCFLCKASAAVISGIIDQAVISIAAEQLEAFRRAFVAQTALNNPNAELQSLLDLNRYPTRSRCILLPVEVLQKILVLKP